MGKLRRFRHGDTSGGRNTPEFTSWSKMISRCYCPTSPRFENWGGRGITVCDEWRSNYSAFLQYMGRKPSPSHSLDRFPNLDGNYEPGNVRWATPEEQSRNRRSCKLVTAFGQTKTLIEWVEEPGSLNYGTVKSRLLAGWPAERALSTPVESTQERSERARSQCRAITRHSRLVSAFGETKPVILWAEQYKISYQVLWARLSRGISPEQALTKPPRRSPRGKHGI